MKLCLYIIITATMHICSPDRKNKAENRENFDVQGCEMNFLNLITKCRLKNATSNGGMWDYQLCMKNRGWKFPSLLHKYLYKKEKNSFIVSTIKLWMLSHKQRKILLLAFFHFNFLQLSFITSLHYEIISWQNFKRKAE